MDLSVVILAGGRAKRLGVDKALIVIKDKPLIGHTFGKIQPLSEDILIVTKSEKREKKLRQVIKAPVRFLIDEDPSIESPLIGALTGIKKAKNELVLLIGCDMPLIKHEVIEKLYKYITGVKALCLAVVPRFPNGYIEPLCAIYNKQATIKALERAIAEKSYRMKTFIKYITANHYFPVGEIKSVDPKLQTFFNVNTREDLIKLMNILEKEEPV